MKHRIFSRTISLSVAAVLSWSAVSSVPLQTAAARAPSVQDAAPSVRQEDSSELVTVIVKVTVTLDAAQCQELEKTFRNGFFTEGYLLLSGTENSAQISRSRCSAITGTGRRFRCSRPERVRWNSGIRFIPRPHLFLLSGKVCSFVRSQGLSDSDKQ